MSKLLATRGAQPVLVVEQTMEFSDWVVDSATNVKKTLGSSVALSSAPEEEDLTGPDETVVTYDFTELPLGAVVVGGELIVVTPYEMPAAEGETPTEATATIAIGIAGSLEVFLAATTSLMDAANTRTALALTTALAANAGLPVRVTLTTVKNDSVGYVTAGKFRVRLEYVVDGKIDVVSL